MLQMTGDTVKEVGKIVAREEDGEVAAVGSAEKAAVAAAVVVPTGVNRHDSFAALSWFRDAVDHAAGPLEGVTLATFEQAAAYQNRF
jgi:hypothetical protein